MASLPLSDKASDVPFSSGSFDAIRALRFIHMGPSTAARVSLSMNGIGGLAFAQDDSISKSTRNAALPSFEDRPYS